MEEDPEFEDLPHGWAPLSLPDDRRYGKVEKMILQAEADFAAWATMYNRRPWCWDKTIIEKVTQVLLGEEGQPGVMGRPREKARFRARRALNSVMKRVWPDLVWYDDEPVGGRGRRITRAPSYLEIDVERIKFEKARAQRKRELRYVPDLPPAHEQFWEQRFAKLEDCVRAEMARLAAGGKRHTLTPDQVQGLLAWVGPHIVSSYVRKHDAVVQSSRVLVAEAAEFL